MKQTLFISLLLSCVFLFAEEKPQPPQVKVPFTQEKINVDGKDDESAWKNAAVIQLREPAFGERKNPIREKLPAKVLLTYDKNYLYFTIICMDRNDRPAGEKHDDELHRGDAVELFIDGIGDHKQYFEIQMNTRDLVRDVNYLFTGTAAELDENGILRDGRNQWDDPCYNIPDFKHKSSFLYSNDGKKTGWRIEAALPAKALLRRSGQTQFSKGMKIRANFVRLKHEGKEMHSLFWSPTVFGRPHRSPGRMGTLILD